MQLVRKVILVQAGAKGDTGAAGKDGKNAEAKVVDNGNGTHTVTIVDGNGQTTSTIVKDGALVPTVRMLKLKLKITKMALMQ